MGKDEFLAGVAQTVKVAQQFKKVMQKKGLTQARAKCPDCTGMLHGSLNGPKQHLWFRCDGTCGKRFIE